MLVKTRFAPSPTGMLHVGNVRTALINWLFTKAHSGVFMLRMDDTDLLRSKKEYEQSIMSDLTWLGIKWDEFVRQSERLERYENIKQKLIDMGRLYPCYETQNELDMKRKMLLSRGMPPIYDRSALQLTEAQHQALIDSGAKPHYRFLLADENITWHDLIRGEIEFQGRNLSDPIVVREDGSMTYILCSAIDDIDFGITHILRGEDHISNTAIGLQITKALGNVAPQIGHTSLLQSKEGEISKRLGGFDIASLRNQFIEPMAINSMLSKMGTSDSIDPTNNIENLISDFNINKFSSSAVNYDVNELLHINHKLVSAMSYEEVQTKLQALGIDPREEFWNAVSGNLNKIDEALIWWKICYEEIEPVIAEKDKEFLYNACNFLPSENWDNSTWQRWTALLKENTGRTGKELFIPLRLALTGEDSGPELKYLLPLIGKERTKKRLQAYA